MYSCISTNKNRTVRNRVDFLKGLIAFGLVLGVCLILSKQARAEKIENDIAVFAALDKVTARISTLEVPIGETKVFGALKITPRICYSRPPTEPPLTSSFVEVQEIKLNGKIDKLFAGWMFAQSPGLSGVEHPVFDVWLTNCKMETGSTSEDNDEKSDLQDSARSSNR